MKGAARRLRHVRHSARLAVLMNRRQRPTVAALICLCVCASAGPSAAQTTPDPDALKQAVRAVERERLEEIGLAALDRFQETWNTRDSYVWSTSLHFPHVRPSASDFRLFPTLEDYAETRKDIFKGLIAAGWHRSQWDARRVIHISPDKMHLAGEYTRRRENGEDISSQQVTYIVTRQGESWGIQSRFGTGKVETGDRPAAAAQAARRAVEAYFRAFNSIDAEAWADTMSFPQVRLSSSGLGYWRTRDDFLAGVEPGRQRTWAGTRLDSADVIQSGANGANVVVRYSRLNAKGEPLATYDAVYLVTHRDGRWAVQARSTYAP